MMFIYRFFYRIKKLSFVLWTFIAIFMWPVSSFAQDDSVAPPDITIHPVVGFSSLNQAINTLLAFMFLGGGLIAFFYIVRGALKYVTAGDNSANTQAARQTIQNAIIGLIILATIYVLFKIVIGIVPGLGQFFI